MQEEALKSFTLYDQYRTNKACEMTSGISLRIEYLIPSGNIIVGYLFYALS